MEAPHSRPIAASVTTKIKHVSRFVCQCPLFIPALQANRTVKGCGATGLFTELLKVGWTDQTENKGLVYRKGEWLSVVQLQILHFKWIKTKRTLFKQTQFNALQLIVCFITWEIFLNYGNFTVQTLMLRSPYFKSTLSTVWAGSDSRPSPRGRHYFWKKMKSKSKGGFFFFFNIYG